MPDTEDMDQGLVDALVQLSFRVMADLARLASDHDLSLTQLRVLAILRDHEPRMAELAAHLGLDRSTVSGLIDRATSRELVERVLDPTDRRSSRVRLTPAGRVLATDLAVEASDHLDPIVRPLTPAQRRSLTALLERVVRQGAP